MHATDLLEWYNAIFFVPMALSALLLVLTSVRLGGHHGQGIGGHHHGGGLRHAPGATRHGVGSRGGTKVRTDNPDGSLVVDLAHQDSPFRHALANLFGFGRAPVLMVLELFFLSYGLFGLLANAIWMSGSRPFGVLILPSFAVAVVGGGVCARLFAAVISKVLPEDTTAALSREALFGLTGTVVYAVTETGGRITIYDDFGSLHDEGCRVPPGAAAIAKGRKARVVDIQPDGRLVVEETV